MDLKIFPSKLRGQVKLVPSKSIAHRAIICAALADGKSELENIAYSDDILATIEAMEALGAKFHKLGDKLIVDGKETLKKENKKDIEINCSESGSTIRFILPILTLFETSFKISTKGRLLDRPMTPYYEIFEREAIKYQREDKVLKLDVDKKIQARSFKMRADISSQFISGMLFSLPLLEGDSELIMLGDMESKAYVDLTIDCLEKFGIKIENREYRSFYIKGGQKYRSRNYCIEGDYSQLAFFAVADALGQKIEILGIEENSLQGDKKILDIVKNFGAGLDYNAQKKSIKIIEGKRRAYSFNGSQIPDIIPIISLLASLSRGETKIIDISRLKIKESDRLKAIYTELKKLGANIEMGEDFLLIKGVEKLKGGVRLDSYKDHRIAMMLAIAASVCEKEVILENAQVVSKSYPNFWQDYRRLGGKYECIMGR